MSIIHMLSEVKQELHSFKEERDKGRVKQQCVYTYRETNIHTYIFIHIYGCLRSISNLIIVCCRYIYNTRL